MEQILFLSVVVPSASSSSHILSSACKKVACPCHCAATFSSACESNVLFIFLVSMAWILRARRPNNQKEYSRFESCLLFYFPAPCPRDDACFSSERGYAPPYLHRLYRFANFTALYFFLKTKNSYYVLYINHPTLYYTYCTYYTYLLLAVCAHCNLPNQNKPPRQQVGREILDGRF